jgi:hypothetical protein
MSRLSGGARRIALLVIGLGLLTTSFVACASSGSPTDGSSPDSGVGGFKTPNPALFTPIPTFPAFTIGAWPSNYSPQNNDTVTIYVICRAQPSNLSSPPQPPNPPVNVHVEIHDPFAKTADGVTDASGLAAIPISFSDPKSGYPVRVYVSAPYGGRTYNAETVFTPNVTQPPPPTATPATPGTTPSATP